MILVDCICRCLNETLVAGYVIYGGILGRPRSEIAGFIKRARWPENMDEWRQGYLKRKGARP